MSGPAASNLRHVVMKKAAVSLPALNTITRMGGDRDRGHVEMSRVHAGEYRRRRCSRRARLSNAEFLEEDLVAHHRIGQHLVPAQDLNVEPDVSKPLEPAEPIGHLGEVLGTI